MRSFRQPKGCLGELTMVTATVPFRPTGMPQGVLGNPQCKGFHSGGLFCSAIAAELGGLACAVTRVAIVRGSGRRDQSG